MSDDVRVELEKLQRMVGMMAIQMFELKRQLETVERDAIADYELVRSELAVRDQQALFRGMLP
jgi:hypothetical protein